MRILPALLLSTLLLTACGSSDAEKAPLPGERISILDLQKELRPSAEINASEVIKIPPARSNQDWPQKGGYPHHNMQNVELGAAEQLEQIWRADIGAGTQKRLPLTAQPVAAEGKVFTLDTKNHVRAFHNQTGKTLWDTSVKHPKEDEPVIAGGISYAGGILYVTSGYNEVLALNPSNGEIYWRTNISAGSRAAPTIANGRVYVVGLNNNIIALSAKDGKILWEYQGVGETTGLLGAASPAADDQMVIAALSSGDLVALRPENGSVIWSDTLANTLRLGGMAGLSDIRGLPVINGDMVTAVSFGGRMAAFDKRNGNRLWQREVSSSETPWVAGNTIYLLSADYQLMALSAASGDVLWVKSVDKYENPNKRKNLIAWSGPIMAGGRLILTGSNGNIAEFNPKNGVKLTSWDAKKTIRLAPIVAGGALYILAEDGSLIAYR